MAALRMLLVWTFFALFMGAILFAPPFIGLADNSDYARALQPLGLLPNEHPRFFHAYREFRLTGETDGGIPKLLQPGVRNELNYVSSQFLIMKAAVALNIAVKLSMRADPTVFDVRCLGALYVILYSFGWTLLLLKLELKRASTRALLFGLILFLFCDTGYLLYFHSFYGEAMTLATAPLTAGCAAWALRGPSAPRLSLLLFYASGFLLASAKVANAPLGALLALFGCALWPLRRDAVSRGIVAAGSAALLASSVLYVSAAPAWMKQVNQYQSIFFGVLKDSPSPERDARELGLPAKFAALHDTHGYMPNPPYDIYSESFQAEVYDRATYADVLGFYLRHPGRLLEKLRISADYSVFLRPSYLGNLEPGASPNGERLAFAERFSYWEPLRKRAAGHALPIAAAVFAMFAAGVAAALFRHYRTAEKLPGSPGAALGALLLLAAAASQLVVPVVGNGEADLQKHMFLFNLCFDLLLLFGAAWVAERIGVRRLVLAAALALLPAVLPRGPAAAPPSSGGVPASMQSSMQANAHADIRPGDIVRFGTWNGTPLLWDVLAADERGYLLWSRCVVAELPFDEADERLPSGSPDDYGSNDWASSDLRQWLNGEFLNAFDANERKALRPLRLKTLLPAARAEDKEEGEQPHYWSSLPLYAEQNYDRAYGIRTADAVFLLDVQQLRRHVAARGLSAAKTSVLTGKPAPYWIRTPYVASESMVRIVGKDSFVYHKDARSGGIGVVPALYAAYEQRSALREIGGDEPLESLQQFRIETAAAQR